MLCRRLTLLSLLLLTSSRVDGVEPLHVRIDQHITRTAQGKPFSKRSDDAEFLRRIYLDLAGRIPSGEEARTFLKDTDPDKRPRLIQKLLDGPDYPVRMSDAFHVMFMERLGDQPMWTAYLRSAFEKNKSWKQMAREILRADIRDAENRGAAFFIAKRLENYGQNPVDYPALTRDIGRLFLGKNLQCAQCHDHLYIDEYTQEKFQGLFAFVQNSYLVDAKTMHVGEKPLTSKISFMSVFKKIPKEIGPTIPGGKENVPPLLKKGEEYVRAPNPKMKDPGQLKFSPLSLLAEQVPENDDFARNIVNRLWFLMMGRGLVHPLDLHHKDNPPSHPELLELLAKEFIAHQYDIKWLLRELAQSETYQRSSILPAKGDTVPPESFRTGIEKRLSAEQLLMSILEATGERTRILSARKPEIIGTKDDPLIPLQTKFAKAFANAPREPEDEFSPELRAALFILNDEKFLALLRPQSQNLVDRLRKRTDLSEIVNELYLHVLTRFPSDAEKKRMIAYLEKHSENRPAAIGRMVWAMLASTEFCVNH